MKRAGRMDRRKVAKQGGSKKFKPEDVAAEVTDKDDWYKTFKKLEVFRKYMETYDGEQDPQLFIEKVNKHRENLDIPLDLIVDNLDFYFRDSKDEEVRRWYSAKKVFVQYWIRQKVSYDEIWGNFSRSLCAYFSHDRHTEAKYSNLNSFEFMQGMSARDFMSTLIKLYRRIDPNVSDEDVIKKAISKLPGEMTLITAASDEKSLQVFEEDLQGVIDAIVPV